MKGVTLKDMLAPLPQARRRRIAARTQELVSEEMTLRDLRKAMGQTQVAVAKKLRVKQETVSRAEQRADMLLSTLDGYLQALGGRLRLVAEFEGRAPVTVRGLAGLSDRLQPGPKRGGTETMPGKPRRGNESRERGAGRPRQQP